MFADKEMEDRPMSFFKLGERELVTMADKWIYFIKSAGSLEYVPEWSPRLSPPSRA